MPIDEIKMKLQTCLMMLMPTLSLSTGVWADQCSSDAVEQAVAKATGQSKSVKIRCDLTLNKAQRITKQIIFEGAKASNTTLDCQGATLDANAIPVILIQSIKQGNIWSVPKNISIKNCIVKGAIRIHGMGRNGESEPVKASSITLGHTERVQQAAPSQIVLDNLNLTAGQSNMVYLAPGVHDVTIKNSQFTGKAGSLAIYLDAESKNNRIEHNHFDVQTPTRELIAVDGSAYNTIKNNTFINPENGAIFFYRNCGEGGTVRHQTPSYNEVSNNTFKMEQHLKQPLIWLGSRHGHRNYCGLDAGYAFGSSQSDLDFAENNQVKANQFELKKAKWYEFWLAWTMPKLIRVDSLNNQVAHNQIISR